MSAETQERRFYRWSIQDMTGTTDIVCHPDDENAVVEARLERKLSRGVPFGMGYRRFEFLRREAA